MNYLCLVSHHAEALAGAGLAVYLLSRPYNLYVEHPNVTRIAGWDDLDCCREVGDAAW